MLNILFTEKQMAEDGHPCFFKANLDESNNNATCSLGYMPFLNNVKEVCSTKDIWFVNSILSSDF